MDNPEGIQFQRNISNDSYTYWEIVNTFTVFKSINNILLLIYTNDFNSIIAYNLINNNNFWKLKKLIVILLQILDIIWIIFIKEI